MTPRDAITEILNDLSQDRVDQVLDYARFLSWQDERQAWTELGGSQLARAYSDDEPEYSEADLKKGHSR